MSRGPKRRPLPRPRAKAKWYTEDDLRKIARAISRDFLIARVTHWAMLFECAADWYFRAREEPDRGRPSETQRKLNKIARAARKLLKHLGVENVDEASDGPTDWVILDALTGATPGGTEESVAQSTARIGRLVELIEATEAAADLHDRAIQGRKDQADFARIRGVCGHRGNIAETNWIAYAMEIYKIITKKDPVPGRGGDGTPLVRFLKAAGAPIGIRLSRDWRSRIRSARKKPPT